MYYLRQHSHRWKLLSLSETPSVRAFNYELDLQKYHTAPFTALLHGRTHCRKIQLLLEHDSRLGLHVCAKDLIDCGGK